MSDVLEKLDQTTLEFFEKLDILQKKRAELCGSMRDGYLNLSQARYSMGNKAVGPIQYGDKMEALVAVRFEEERFELDKLVPGKTTKKTDETTLQDSPNSGLRKRKIHGLEKQGETETVEENHELESRIEDLKITGSEKIRDPINWFGVLVPACLRTGQHNFKIAVDLCCEIANLENELSKVIEHLQELKTKKQELVSTCSKIEEK